MTEETKPEKGMSYPFREEDAAHASRNLCKSVPHAANDDVLEDCRIPCEGRLFFRLQVVSLIHKLDWQLKYWLELQ